MGGQVAGVINGLFTAFLVPTGQQVVRRLTVPVTVGVGPPLPSKRLNWCVGISDPEIFRRAFQEME